MRSINFQQVCVLSTNGTEKTGYLYENINQHKPYLMPNRMDCRYTMNNPNSLWTIIFALRSKYISAIFLYVLVCILVGLFT